jgi:hypothetical protein
MGTSPAEPTSSARLVVALEPDKLKGPVEVSGIPALPTSSARLVVALESDRLEGSVEVGGIPGDQARALITIFGMIAAVVAGIAGAVVTVSVAPAHVLGWFGGLAAAELALALVVVLLIAPGVRVSTRPEVLDEGQARPAISPGLP